MEENQRKKRKKVVNDVTMNLEKTISLKTITPKTRKIKPSDLDLTQAKAKSKPKSVNDIYKSEDSANFSTKAPSYQTIYFQVEEKKFPLRRKLELIRMAGTGVLILFILNLFSIYQRGVVLKNDVVAEASNGLESLVQAGELAKKANFNTAGDSFENAKLSFESAQDTLGFLQTNQDLFYTREQNINSVHHLLMAAQEISTAGENFTLGIKNLQNLPTLFLQTNVALGSKLNTDQKPQSLTEKLKSDLKYLETAHENLISADEHLKQVSPDILPKELKAKLITGKQTVKALIQIMEKTEEKIPVFLDLLGDRYPHRYLVLLQNDAEARPTGGFIGSYIIIDLNDGYITKFQFNDVYDSDGQLKDPIPAPEEISKLTKYWRLRDSNYSPDFSISAEKAAWFLQKQKGPSVDTVIAINQSFLKNLLNVTGPVNVEGLQAPLTAENYNLLLSYIVESKLTGETTPKRILEKFIQSFQHELFSSTHFKETLLSFIQGTKQKKILFYSRKEEVQKLFDEYALSGKINPLGTKEDYINITPISIGGNKSDAYTVQQVVHNTLIGKDGSLSDEVTIRRRHTWTERTFEDWKYMLKPFGYTEIPDHLKEILGAGPNRVNMKIYVPLGSTLEKVVGIEKEKVTVGEDKELGLTFFLFEQLTIPGAESQVTLTYNLPAKLNLLPADTYKLSIQSTPSFNPVRFEKNIFTQTGIDILKAYPEGFKLTETGFLTYSAQLTSNTYLSALIAN